MVDKGIHTDIRHTWIQIPCVPLTSSVILGKMMNFFETEPQFPHLQIEGANLASGSRDCYSWFKEWANFLLVA